MNSTLRKFCPLPFWAGLLFVFCLGTNPLQAQQFSKNLSSGSTVFVPTGSQKIQMLFSSADLGSPPTGIIDKIYFEKSVGATTSVTLTNFVVKLGFITGSTFGTNGTTFIPNLTTVLSSPSYTINASTGNTFFAIDVANLVTYSLGGTLVVELSSTASSSASFAVNFSTGPSSPSNKVLTSTSVTAATGTASITWRDFGFDIGSAGAAQANNLCGSSTLLTLSTACSPVAGTTIGASQDLAPISCLGGAASSAAKDVWYTFTALAADDSLIVQGLGGFDPVLQLFSGSCAGLTSIDCADDPNFNITEKLSPGTLTPGTTYFLRIYGWNGLDGVFTVCAKSNNVAAPPNDFCASATTLFPANICSAVSGTIVGATQTLPAATNCTSTQVLDVWYQFTAGASNDTVIVTSGGVLDPIVEMFSGNCSDGVTSLGCVDNPTNSLAVEKIAPGTLTPGTTYLVRVYGFGANTGSFTICAKTSATTGPANDNCATPTVVSAGVTVNGNNIAANQSIAPIQCNNFTSPQAANDAWYRFTKTSAIDSLIVTPSGFDLVVDVRENNCATGANLTCGDEAGNVAERISLEALVDGTTYLFRVYGWNGASGNFTVLLKDASATSVPANDLCTNASQLSVGTSCQFIAGTNVGSSTTQAAATCSGANPGIANDVWYRFQANGDKVIINAEFAAGFDGAVALYSGSCGAPVEAGCADAFGSSAGSTTTEIINASGLTNGQTYFIRVYGFNNATGTFAVCVFNPGCTSVAGTLTTSVSTVTSNQAFTVNLTGGQGAISYEFSDDQVSWIPYTGLDDAVDTMVIVGTQNTTLFVRAVTQNGTCFPGYSPVVQMPFRCATRFSNSLATTNDFIKQVQLNTLNQTSTENPLGGNVQDFTAVSTTLCRGNNYPITIATNFSGVAYNRMVWMDLNQDGDFGDAGENLLFGPFVTSATNPVMSITIPATATLGNTKMRVAIINNGAAITSADACAAGPYSLGEIEEYSVNISAGVPANAGPNQSICATSTLLAGNDPGAGNTGTWTVVSGSGTFAQANQFNSGVSGLSPGNNVFRWTIVSACGTTNATVTITSSQLTAVAGPDAGVCSASGNLSANTPANGTGTWTLLSGSGTIATPNSPNSTVSALGIGANQFIWTVSSPGCPSKTDTLTLTRSADPSNANAGTAQTLCSTSTTLNASVPTVGIGQWSVLQGGATISNPSLANSGVTGMSSGVNVFRWTVSNGTCTPKMAEVTVTVTEPPVAQAGVDQNICVANALVNGNSPAGATYQWNLISGAGSISNATSASTTITNVGTGQNVFSYTVSRPGCPTDMDTLVITRKAIPTAFAGTDQTLCTNSATLTASVPSEGTGQWTLISGSGQIASPTSASSAVTGLAVGDNVFRWTVTNSPCSPVSDDVTITTTGNAVAANAGNDATICAANYNVVGNSPGTGTGTWTLVSGSGTIASPNTASTQITGLGVGINVFRWTITNGVCPPSSDEVLVTRTPATTIAAAGTDQTLCATSATLSANIPTQGTGLWTVVSGTGTFANPTNPTTAVAGLSTGNNTFRWTIANAPCQASFDEVTINTSGASTTANAGLDQVLCVSNVTLSGNTATQGTGQWTIVSGTGTFASASDPNTLVTGLGVGDNVFRWTITNGACPPSLDDVSITRKAEAQTPNAGTDQNICTSTATLSASAPTVGIGTWTLISGTGTLINPNSASTQVTGLGAGANVFRFTVTNSPCQPVSDEVTVTTTLAATTALAGADQTICSNTANLSANNPVTGTGLWTVLSGSGTFANAGSPNTSVSGLGSGTNVFQWTITSGGPCPPSSDNVSIIVQTAPTVANAGNDQTLCGSSVTLAANQPTTGTGKWTLVSGSGQFVNDSDPASQVINLGNGANTFRWTISNSPCPATQDEVVVNSTPANVTADAGLDKTVCGTTANLTATTPTIGSGTWSLIGGTGQIVQAGQAVTGVFGLGTGANQFLWTVVNGSCTATDVVTISREANPVHLGPDTLFCVETNPNYTLVGPSGMTAYLWSNGLTSNQITVSQTNQYILGVVTPNQCPFSDTVGVAFSICTEIEGQVEGVQPAFAIVPNPSVDDASLRIVLPKQEAVSIEVLDMKGVVIRPSIVHSAHGKSEVALPNDLAAGAYLLKIKGASFVKTLKWVVE